MTAERKKVSLPNTTKCILVLSVIAVVCVLLLSVANSFLKVEAVLDKATGALINSIAPTGLSDDEAYSSAKVKMIDISKESGYKLTSIDDYNKKFGSASKKVRALYTSTDKNGAVTYVVEAEGKGYVDAIVMLIAYTSDGKVSALVTKSQSESYWNHIHDLNALCASFVGSSGDVTVGDIAASTGVTVRGTLGGMTGAVSIANDFIARLGVNAGAEVSD